VPILATLILFAMKPWEAKTLIGSDGNNHTIAATMKVIFINLYFKVINQLFFLNQNIIYSISGAFEMTARWAGWSKNKGIVYFSASGAWVPDSCPLNNQSITHSRVGYYSYQSTF
jgi:hypothetical protein